MPLQSYTYGQVMWNDKVNIYIHESAPQCIINRDSDATCGLLLRNAKMAMSRRRSHVFFIVRPTS